jgi:hypothetical protein
MATLTAGSSYSFTMDPHGKLTLVVSGQATLSFVSDSPNLRSNFVVTDAQSRTYGPYGAIGTMTITAVDRSLEYTIESGVPMLSSDGLSLVSGDGETWALTQTYTWATLPAAANYIGTAHVTDIGARGSLWRSDGSTWGVVGGSVVLGAYGADLTVTAASTSEVDLVTLDIPAGLMGLNGQLVVTHFWEATNNANVKTMRVKLGGTAFFANAVGVNSNAIFLPPQTIIWNRNSQSSQMAFAAANGNTTVATGTAKTTGTVDTSAATTLVISGQKATGSDTLTLLGYRVELVRP